MKMETVARIHLVFVASLSPAETKPDSQLVPISAVKGTVLISPAVDQAHKFYFLIPHVILWQRAVWLFISREG